MKDVIYIDSNVMVGRRGPKDKLSPWQTETYLEEMEYCGIDAALVLHSFSREYDPLYGNKKILEEVKKSDRLIPIWSALPHHCEEFPHPKEFVKMMKDNNVRCAALFPKSHQYSLSKLVCGEIYSAFSDNEFPIFLTSAKSSTGFQQTTLEEVDRICEDFPDLKVVLICLKFDSARDIVAMMKRHKNLYLEFSTFQANMVFEYFISILGPDRLLFGTDFPEKSIGAAKAFVDYSDISMENRKKIAGGNLAKLLKLEKMPAPRPENKNDEPILKLVKEGKPLNDILIIDAHSHMAHNEAQSVGNLWQRNSSISGMVERNKRIGVDKLLISSWLAIYADYVEGNAITLDAMKQFPEVVVGLAGFDPNYDVNWDTELEEAYIKQGFRGMKPYQPRNGLPYNSPVYDKWYEFANKHHLFALMHMSPNFKAEMLDIAGRYQNITFILAHSGMSFAVAREHIEIAKKRSNCVLEITLTAVTFGVIEYLVKEVGADRVVYGTDQPMRDPIPQFGWVVYSHLTDEERKKILGTNMQKVLDKCKI
jgi:predicted TIM-barrel fold metal-dependent hydrolase